MKKYLLLAGVGFCCFSGTALAAFDCAPPPSCADLGYTMTTSQCSGKVTLKCPLDLNAVWCTSTTSSGRGGDGGNSGSSGNGGSSGAGGGGDYEPDGNESDSGQGGNHSVSEGNEHDEGFVVTVESDTSREDGAY